MSEVLSLRSSFPVPVSELWAWHERPGAFERLAAPWESMRVLERHGGLEVGARTSVRVQVGPTAQTWVSEHTACEPHKLFKDEARQSPFAAYAHEHRFSRDGSGKSALEDHVEYTLPLGGLGSAVAGGMVKKRLAAIFRYRHAVLKADLERHLKFATAPRLNVAITGASGMLGTALGHYLSTAGHDVRAVRRTGIGIDAGGLEGAHACIHLAGAGIAEQRWTPARKKELVDSRVGFTANLLEQLERLQNPPAVLIAASAVGVYGDRGDEELGEATQVGEPGPKGPEFLASLCQQWETASRKAEELGMRVVILRLGVVLTSKGGALKKMLPPFAAGVGGPLAGGKAWFPWVSLEDVLGAAELALHDKSIRGVMNVVAPNPVTNATLTRVLGKVLVRPAFTPVPALALRALYGELADGAVLASQRVLPGILQQRGFDFVHPDLEQCLRFTLGR